MAAIRRMWVYQLFFMIHNDRYMILTVENHPGTDAPKSQCHVNEQGDYLALRWPCWRCPHGRARGFVDQINQEEKKMMTTLAMKRGESKRKRQVLVITMVINCHYNESINP